jgi:uncharacterized protein (TIGR00730 family)
MAGLRRVCVFCGSSFGVNPAHAVAAERLGALLARERIGLVFGGGCIGLMGRLADAALGAGGEVVGVIPRALVNREVAHLGLTELRVVESMHERKALMADLADGFVALPGGLGTVEEFCEILTWAQLGIHSKPCGLLNVDGYFDPLLAFFDHVVAEGFVTAESRALVLVANDCGAILEALRRHEPAPVARWLDDAQR